MIRGGCGSRLRLGIQLMRSDQMFIDDSARDDMLLDDSLQDRRVALAVPRSFRVHDCDRTAFADAEAIRLRPQHAALL
jgi:hypothetical protein